MNIPSTNIRSSICLSSFWLMPIQNSLSLMSGLPNVAGGILICRESRSHASRTSAQQSRQRHATINVWVFGRVFMTAYTGVSVAGTDGGTGVVRPRRYTPSASFFTGFTCCSSFSSSSSASVSALRSSFTPFWLVDRRSVSDALSLIIPSTPTLHCGSETINTNSPCGFSSPSSAVQ